jgi:hypothetical protein
MSESEELAAFERQLGELLQRDADGASGRVRSRLNQARHAALREAGERRGLWRPSLTGRRVWLPAAGALAAAALLVLLLGPRPAPPPPFGTGAGVVMAAQDMTLLTDRDGLALVEDGGGQFYEWAAAQSGNTPASPAAADGEPDQNGG